MPIFLTLALDRTPAARRGTAGGVITAALFAGQILSPLSAMPLIASSGYSTFFFLLCLLLSLLAIAAALAGLSFKSRCLTSAPMGQLKSI